MPEGTRSAKADQRPGHTKVLENAGPLDSLPLPTSGGISQGTQLPLVPFNSFQRKGAVEINASAGRGCSRIAPSACREAGQPLSPTADRIFSHVRPPTPRLPRCSARRRPWQPWQPPHTRPSHGPGRATAAGTGLQSSVPSDPTVLCPFNRCGGRGVPAAEERNSSFHQGALGVQVRGGPPECLLPEKMCLERSEVASLLSPFFFFFNICLSITLSAYLTLSLPSFCFFFFSLSLYCRNVSLVAVSNTLLIFPCHSEPVSFSFFSLYVSLLPLSFLIPSSFSLSLSLSPSHKHTHTHTHTLMIPP